jgi:VCBS repeat protein
MPFDIPSFACAAAISLCASTALYGQSFSGPTQIPLGYNNQSRAAQFVAGGDINKDGKSDLLVGLYQIDSFGNATNARILVLKGDGTGKFTNSTLTNVSAYVQTGTMADVNGDGNSDLITAYGASNGHDGFLNVFTSDGKGGFTKTNVLALPQASASYLAVADFNGDKKPDILEFSEIQVGKEDWTDVITVFLNHGDGTFTQGPVMNLESIVGGSTSLVAGDFNGDGKMDIAFLTGGILDMDPDTAVYQAVTVMLNTGNGTFNQGQTYTFPGTTFISSLAAADLNKDGRTDLVVGLNNSQGSPANRLVTLQAKANGDLFWLGATTLTAQPSAVTLSDLSGDGKVDAAVTLFNGTIRNYKGNGAGRFTGAASYSVGANGSGVAAVPLTTGKLPSLFFGVGASATPTLGLLTNTTK